MVTDDLKEEIAETSKTDNTMLEYASTNAKALLSMLKNTVECVSLHFHTP